MKTLPILTALLLASVACASNDGNPADPGAGSGGSGAASFTTWSIGFTPQLDVAACWSSTDQPLFCGEVVHVDSTGAFHDVWEPPHPNTIQADGTMTATTFSATLKCAGTGSASGSMSATWTGSEYDGTATLNGRAVSIWVRKGLDTTNCAP